MIKIKIGIILLAIFLPVCITLVYSVIRRTGSNTSKAMTNEHFTVSIPSIVLIIGIACALMSTLVILGFTFLSAELPHVIFYIAFGLFLWLGVYLFLKTIKFKVIVNEKLITVHSVFSKSFTFEFSEIVSAVRQIKNNQVKSERIVVKTKSGKKFIVESSEVAYKLFLQKIKMEVKSECLSGFEM